MQDPEADVARLLENTLKALEGLAVDDRDAVADAGAQLESAVQQLPGDTPKVGSVLSLGLEVLERLYLGEAEEGEAELGALRHALECAATWVQQGYAEELEPAVEEAGDTLWRLLGKDLAVSPFLGAADADEAPPSVPDLTIEDVAALLIGLSPDDLDELRPVHRALSRLAKEPAWPESAREQAQQAAAALGELVDSSTDNPDASFDEAVEAVGAIPPLLEAEAEPEQPPSPEPEAQPEAAPQEDQSAEKPAPAAEVEFTTLEFDGDLALLGEFVTESLEHIENIESGLLDLEADPDDTEAVNAVFRGFHTIKGSAGFLGLGHVQRLAHRAETLLDRVREGEIRLTGGYADLALESGDMLKDMLAELQELQEGEEPPAPPEALSDLLARLTDPEAAGITEDTGEVTPAVARVGDILVAEGKADREPVEVAAASADGARIGEKLVRAGVAGTKDVAQALRRQRKAAGAGGEASVRVRTDRLDALINMVGELVIANAMLDQDQELRTLGTHGVTRKVDQISKITRELQRVSMSLRMVPLRGTFQKMARLVRDLARKAGKQVQFVTEGEDTEIDRNMVEALADPLLHMVRNAVDHGIESAEERAASGKPEAGTVTLRAYHEAGNVVIELEDDGKGLDRESILSKAVRQGIVDANKDLSDEEVFKLIFEAGLSTAEQITDVSGRGVGMDVVRRNIESLRGRVEIASTRGQGSTFSIRVPLTLAIIDGMLLRVGTERYVLPTVVIQQAFRAEPHQLSTVTGRGEMVMFRGDLIPVIRLDRLFGIAGASEDICEGVLVVAEHEGELSALAADELLGQQQIVIKSLGEGLGDVPEVSGSAILGDGRVGLILDVGGILEVARSTVDDPQAAAVRRAA